MKKKKEIYLVREIKTILIQGQLVEVKIFEKNRTQKQIILDF